MELNPSEIDLLLAAARAAVGRVDRRLTSAVAAGALDWGRLLAAAECHGMKALLHRHLDSLGLESFPAAFTERLRIDFAKLAQRNLWLAGELVRVVRVLEGEGIQAIAWKGPALAVYLYGDVALRQFDDLDLLVRLSDVPRAVDRLRAEGFASTPRLTPSQMAALARSECDILLTRPSSRLFLELHWDIVPPSFGFSCGVDALWPRIERVELGDARVAVPGAEDLLLCLSVNAAKEMWQRFEWITAVAVLCASGRPVDWTALMKRARLQGVERMLLVGLYLARQWLESDFPETVRARLGVDRRVRRLGEHIGELLFRCKGPALGWWPVTRFRLQVRERPSDRFRYCVVRAMTPTYRDVAALRLSRAPLALYYLFRPIRLLLRVPGALRRALARESHPR